MKSDFVDVSGKHFTAVESLQRDFSNYFSGSCNGTDWKKVIIDNNAHVNYVNFTGFDACIISITIQCGHQAGSAYAVVRAQDIKAKQDQIMGRQTPTTHYCVIFQTNQPNFIKKLRLNETALHCGDNANCIRKNIELELV